MMLELETHTLTRCQDREERWPSSTEETPEQRILKETSASRLKQGEDNLSDPVLTDQSPSNRQGANLAVCPSYNKVSMKSIKEKKEKRRQRTASCIISPCCDA
jgi:hypothetical protein